MKFFLLLLLFSKAYAQESLGFVHSKYAGINSVFINPTHLLNSKIFIDVNIIGAGAFIHNNLAYLPKKTFAPAFNQTNTNPTINTSEVIKRGFVDAKVIGPSVGVSYDNFSFGFFVRARFMAEAKVTKDLASFALNNNRKNYDYVGLDIKNQKAFLSTAAWTEFGINFGYMYNRNHYVFKNIAVNLKYLVGISHSNVALKDLDLSIPDSNQLDNIHVKAAYRITKPQWNAGKGFSLDLGWSYAKMLDAVSNYYPNNKRKSGCKHIDYKFRFGVSITDLGLINYSKNAFVKQIEYTDGDVNLDSTKTNSLESIDSEINKAGNGLSVKSKTHYIALMPIGLSAQYDYNFENNFYLNTTLIVGIRIPYQVKRPDILGVTLRYDRKYFGAAIPVSLYNWTYPQLGFCLRFGNNLIIGTDRAGFLFGKVRNTYGADVYVNLKFAIYKHCKKKRKKMKSIMDCISKDAPLLD
jgi:hypothetical protein